MIWNLLIFIYARRLILFVFIFIIYSKTCFTKAHIFIIGSMRQFHIINTCTYTVTTHIYVQCNNTSARELTKHWAVSIQGEKSYNKVIFLPISRTSKRVKKLILRVKIAFDFRGLYSPSAICIKYFWLTLAMEKRIWTVGLSYPRHRFIVNARFK